jgi:hypothetical protein
MLSRVSFSCTRYDLPTQLLDVLVILTSRVDGVGIGGIVTRDTSGVECVETVNCQTLNTKLIQMIPITAIRVAKKGLAVPL